MSKKERKLTEKELERKALFEKTRLKLEQEGFKSTHLTMGVLKANILAIFVMAPFVLFFCWLYSIVNLEIDTTMSSMWGVLFLPIFLLLGVAHEGIHGITWGIFAKDHFKSIEFGVIWKMLTPYCTCKDALKKWQYMLGSAMPTIILGGGMELISIFLNNYILFLLSLLMVLSGGGDFIVILMIIFHKPTGNYVLYCDHPYELGVVVFEK